MPDTAPQSQWPAKSGLAIASLVCGIASFLFWFAGSLAAIICGHLALSRIRKSGNRLAGKGMAIAGLVCGYFTLVISVAALTAAIVTPIIMHRKANERAEIDRQHAVELYHLLKKYESEHGSFPPTLGELETGGYTDSIARLQPQRGGNWHYYTGQSSKDSGGNLLLLAPESDMAVFIDGRTERLKSYSAYMHAKSRMRNHQSVQE